MIERCENKDEEKDWRAQQQQKQTHSHTFQNWFKISYLQSKIIFDEFMELQKKKCWMKYLNNDNRIERLYGKEKAERKSITINHEIGQILRL